MENPYTSPSSQGQLPVISVNPHYSGFVQQVRVMAILTSVNGGMMLLAGLGFVGMAVFASMVLVPEMQKQNNQPMPNWLLPSIYAGMGSGALISGILQLYSGIQAYQYRGRKLMIVSLFAGLTGLCTFYCAFTILPLTIYGLIVLFNPAVVQAFQMRKDGRSVPEILAYFGYQGTGQV